MKHRKITKLYNLEKKLKETYNHDINIVKEYQDMYKNSCNKFYKEKYKKEIDIKNTRIDLMKELLSEII